MLYLLLIINLITFVVYALDKWKAAKHKRRIPESVLLFLTFLGSTIGAVCAMMMFRHKISKKSFLWKFGLIVLIQIVILFGCWKFKSVITNTNQNFKTIKPL